MTQGRIVPILVKFTIPLVLGNLLQLTYNAVDSIIVGRYVGKEALAAVGTSNPLLTLIILSVQGICLGAGILVGTLYGAKDYKTLKREVSTAMLSGVAFSLVLTAAALAAAPHEDYTVEQPVQYGSPRHRLRGTGFYVWDGNHCSAVGVPDRVAAMMLYELPSLVRTSCLRTSNHINEKGDNSR